MKFVRRGGGGGCPSAWPAPSPIWGMSDYRFRPDPCVIPHGPVGLGLNRQSDIPLAIWDCWLLTAHLPACRPALPQLPPLPHEHPQLPPLPACSHLTAPSHRPHGPQLPSPAGLFAPNCPLPPA
uniref:Uncharacterized protein n=1 Tax=Myotis myotis TaxID=51298 RepID=A0A7J7XZV6_MYOMY|nr:hypothetical protein mMyoMyo1_011410 [Myotis myotis]